MITLNDLITATADTIKIDWLKVEDMIGFSLQDMGILMFMKKILMA